ncbi:hypothetical protein [Nocardia abscessus]|uniref:hypothetical protein n=2 Tax=Nocardia abscessus TaxID=120957 RepID=UPI0024584B4F|nr:hypothetical protein [Nocardia abscessus]
MSDTWRIVIDGTMRSISHPDVYAVGDAAFAFICASAAWSVSHPTVLLPSHHLMAPAEAETHFAES